MENDRGMRSLKNLDGGRQTTWDQSQKRRRKQEIIQNTTSNDQIVGLAAFNDRIIYEYDCLFLNGLGICI